MKAIYLKLILVVFPAFFFACSSHEIRSEKESTLTPSKKAEPILRKYQESLSCQLMSQPVTTAFEREKISALSGFAVGPESALHAPDLSKPILRPFSSDGCSSSPDGVPLTQDSSIWVDCCVRHDTAYWMGGTREEKNKADDELRACMSEKGYPKIGKMYKGFVAELGGPLSTQSYRWGYGWNYKRNYSDLTEEENNQIKRMYGVDKNKFSDFMMNQSFHLQRICDPADPVFYGLRKEEVAVYRFLNARLSKQDVITWARLKNFNRGGFTYEIKLQSCDEAVLVSFFEDAKKPPELKSTCGL